MSVNENPIRVITRFWWIYLATGVLWVLFGRWLCSYRVGSLIASAVGPTLYVIAVTLGWFHGIFTAFQLRPIDRVVPTVVA